MVAELSKYALPSTYEGRMLGIVIVVAVQAVVGVTHAFLGSFLILAGPTSLPLFSTDPSGICGSYTLIYGLWTTIFAYGLWMGNRWGWTGTVAVSAFATAVYVLSLLNLPLIPGASTFGAVGGTIYSLMILLYILQPNIRRTLMKTK